MRSGVRSKVMMSTDELRKSRLDGHVTDGHRSLDSSYMMAPGNVLA